MNLYIGADLGTSALKLLLLNSSGEILRSVTKEYPVYYPKPTYSEQDPRDWWQDLRHGIPELCNGYNPDDIKGIGIGGQMHGLVMLDEYDEIIRPVILWNDGRTDKETAYLNRSVGKCILAQNTANIAFAGFTAPKILWVKKNEPENFLRISKIMLPKDYLNYLLTGVHATDYSDAAGTLLLDVKNKCWSNKMLSICGINESMMPRLFESYQKIGTLKPEIAEVLGLSPETVVAAGGGDNALAALGTGTVGEGKCNISLGTSGTVFIPSGSFPEGAGGAMHCFCHADGGYHLMGCMLSAASCNKWFCDGILGTKDYAAEQINITDDKLGKNDVYFLPYLMGERSPINDTDARGTFIGLRMDSSRADMVEAVLEGVAFAIRDNLELAKKQGVTVNYSTLCGGGAKSPLWQKIIANVLGIDIVLPKAEEGPAMGGAMLSMVASGECDDIAKLSMEFFEEKARITPDSELVALYDEKYNKWSKIYPSVKTLFGKIK